MGHWWITFTDRAPACAGMSTFEEAKELGAAAGTIDNIFKLPYPASPRLDDKEGWGRGQHPSFCHDPDKCKGRSSCPKSRACDD